MLITNTLLYFNVSLLSHHIYIHIHLACTHVDHTYTALPWCIPVFTLAVCQSCSNIHALSIFGKSTHTHISRKLPSLDEHKAWLICRRKHVCAWYVYVCIYMEYFQNAKADTTRHTRQHQKQIEKKKRLVYIQSTNQECAYSCSAAVIWQW